MKKLNLKGMLNFRSFALVGIFTVAIVASSCNKADDVFYTEPVVENQDLKAGKAVKKSDMSIAEIAIEAGFDSLVVALSYVDAQEGTSLVDLFMNGTDQYTVFAPTNEAFAALVGDGKISDLPSGLVLNVLLYHVTEGRRAANSVVPKNNTRTIETLLEGASFSVGTDAMITAVGNTANFVVVDGKPLVNISASNGIIHVIDTVILPITL